MSEHQSEQSHCPNCGFEVTENYCARCGQKNGLHKDTFGGLLLHFFEHYFHYDNKFWQTMKALAFSPGKLTVAYWQNERMRYIAPISLYIFVSAVYFFIAALLVPVQTKNVNTASFKNMQLNDGKPVDTHTLSGKIQMTMRKAEQKPGSLEYVVEKISHNYAKAFFFMVPFVALILKLLFARRSDLYYVDHVIFSLHCHSMYFIIGIVTSFVAFAPQLLILSFLGMAALIIYYILAMERAYRIGTGRAILYTLIIGAIYASVISSLVLYYIYYVINGM